MSFSTVLFKRAVTKFELATLGDNLVEQVSQYTARRPDDSIKTDHWCLLWKRSDRALTLTQVIFNGSILILLYEGTNSTGVKLRTWSISADEENRQRVICWGYDGEESSYALSCTGFLGLDSSKRDILDDIVITINRHLARLHLVG